MVFIHKNVNSALLMLITFISVALVTTTVVSIAAFDNMNQAYAHKAMEAQALAAELAEKQANAETAQKTAQLSAEREQALAHIVQQQKDDVPAPAEPVKTTAIYTNKKSTGLGYDPFRIPSSRYGTWA